MRARGIVYYNLKDYDKAIYWLSEFSKAMPNENKEMVSYLRASAKRKHRWSYKVFWGISKYDTCFWIFKKGSTIFNRNL